METSKKTPDLLKRRTALLKKRKEIEAQIIGNQSDEKALAVLRTDYRQVCDELETFYDDIPVKQED